ncbi:unnamed protein product [Pleuronectes platessa]|uniref:Uncharacterized protein n=1 Tax=Pleuronectes platessa TaxID=8262 RepID=A0A9N7UJX6_PLEPL|nr:unnamed protein product [Pleuronectes platessa]
MPRDGGGGGGGGGVRASRSAPPPLPSTPSHTPPIHLPINLVMGAECFADQVWLNPQTAPFSVSSLLSLSAIAAVSLSSIPPHFPPSISSSSSSLFLLFFYLSAAPLWEVTVK